MGAPDGLAIKIYLTLLKLYADQNEVHISGDFEVDGVKFYFDTRDSIPSCQEIVKRYGKTKKELERESKQSCDKSK